MKQSFVQLSTRVLVLGVVVAIVTLAYIVRSEAIGTTFATNGINLKIDSKAWYNGASVPSATWALKDLVPGVDKFFNFDDIKPGDVGCNVISMHVKNQDAWMCLDFKNFQSAENGVNEPEGYVEPGGQGELGGGTEFFGWRDDGDGKFEPPSEKALFGTTTQAASTVLNNTTYVIGDSTSGGSCRVNTTRYVGMCWCAGNLTVNSSTGKMECDASALGNEAQTDSWSVDVSIRAQPVKDKKNFACVEMPPHKDPPDKECKAKGFDFGIAKFEWKGGAWVLDGSIRSPYSATVQGTAQSVSWTASPSITGVVGKTGGQGVQTKLFPGGFSGTINAWKPVVQNPQNFHDISHITLCGKKSYGYGGH